MRGMFILALLLTSATASYAQSTQSTPNTSDAADSLRALKVFDAQGKPIGPLDTYDHLPGVYLRFGHAAVFMPVRHKKVSAVQYATSQFEWDDSAFATYASSDCSGTPFIGGVSTSPRPVALVRMGADVTAYVAGVGLSSKMTGNSYRSYDGVCYASAQKTAHGWTPQTSFSLTQHYPEPLSIHY